LHEEVLLVNDFRRMAAGVSSEGRASWSWPYKSIGCVGLAQNEALPADEKRQPVTGNVSFDAGGIDG